MSVRVLRGAGVCRAAVTGHRGAAARRAVATGAARPAAVHLTGDVGVTRRCGPGARAVHATRRAAQQEGEGAVGGRHDPAIRQDPRHKKWGGMMDILEYEAEADRFRDQVEGSFPMDGVIDDLAEPGDRFQDPFANGYLTEDDIVFPDDYKHTEYLPDRVKQQVYFLYCDKGWTVQQLSQRFRLRAERVSAIIAMKRNEPELKASGRYRTELDELLTKLYAGTRAEEALNETGEVRNDGINVKILKDDQLPDDVFPQHRLPANALPVRVGLPKLDLPPQEERTHKSKLAFTDISAEKKDPKAVRVVDWDGTARAATPTERLYRTWTPRTFTPRRDPKLDPDYELRTMLAEKAAERRAAAAMAEMEETDPAEAANERAKAEAEAEAAAEGAEEGGDEESA